MSFRANKKWFEILCLWLVVVVAYGNVYWNTFLYDDEFFIVKNAFYRSWGHFFDIFQGTTTTGAGGVDSFYRPLQGELYLIVFQLFGLSTVAFHALNVLIHALNAMMVFLLGGRLGFHQRACFVVALLWAAHPVHTEAVTYMSATADVLYAFFCLLGLWFLVGKRLVWASVIYVFGILSKEASVVFLPLSLLCLFVVSAERWKVKTYLKTWPFFLITLGYLLARKTFLNFDNTFNFYKESNLYTENILYRVYTFLATLPSYVKILFYPSPLHLDKEFPVYIEFFTWPVLLGLALVLFATWKVFRDLRRGILPLAFGLLWFFMAYFPHTGILVPMNAFFLDHWLYLPTVGLLLGVGETAYQSLKTYFGKLSFQRAFIAIIGIILCVEMVLTWRQNTFWSDPITFYSHILENSQTGSARVHNNLAMAYADQGEFEKAIRTYEKAISVSDEYPQTHHNLALVFLRLEKIPKAVEHLDRAIQINSQFYQSYEVLARIYEAQGDKAQAEKFQKDFLRIRSQFVK
ncbi:MAG: tetratricopeptide repeat protein [Bdellovibrionales bacterium]